MVVVQPPPSSAAPTFLGSVVILIVLFVVFVVESFFELFITIRAPSCLSSIRRCPSGSNRSPGASSVFIVLMVGSMIVISLAFEGSRFARRKPSWFSRNRRRQQRL
jgi:hypothetical protein